jgi:hypothetical protein
MWGNTGRGLLGVDSFVTTKDELLFSYLLSPSTSQPSVGIGDREDEMTHLCGLDDKHVEILWMM